MKQKKTNEEEVNLNMDNIKRFMLEKALERNAGNRKNAAHDLGISERTLYRRIKDMHIDESKIVDKKTVIDLNRKLVSSLDGRCFINMCSPERMEGFCFTKTSTGIDTLYIGCDNHWGYSHLYHDNYGSFRPANIFCGKEIQMVTGGSPDVREIEKEKFVEMSKVIVERITIYRQRDEEFEKVREKFYND